MDEEDVCVRATEEEQPWIQIDLEMEYYISKVRQVYHSKHSLIKVHTQLYILL